MPHSAARRKRVSGRSRCWCSGNGAPPDSRFSQMPLSALLKGSVSYLQTLNCRLTPPCQSTLALVVEPGLAIHFPVATPIRCAARSIGVADNRTVCFATSVPAEPCHGHSNASLKVCLAQERHGMFRALVPHTASSAV
jgi:hypothetical protein